MVEYGDKKINKRFLLLQELKCQFQPLSKNSCQTVSGAKLMFIDCCSFQYFAVQIQRTVYVCM